MPFSRPTLSELSDRVRDDVDARLPGADSRLRRSVLDVLGRVLAGAIHGVYGLLDWLWRQIFPDTAEGAQLARWAAIWGVQRKAARPRATAISSPGRAAGQAIGAKDEGRVSLRQMQRIAIQSREERHCRPSRNQMQAVCYRQQHEAREALLDCQKSGSGE